MCGQRNCRNRCGRMTRQESGGGNNTCCCNPCICGGESTAPTATISMADYQPFILVPTTVFDQGDEDCGCNQAVGFDW